jgi:hypothetical protein
MENLMKNGVVASGNKFLVYINDEQIYSARTEDRAKRIYEDNVRKLNKKTKAAPVAEMIIPMRKEPEQKQAHTAVYVPSKEAEFVPFGEFSDINTIVKSRMFFPCFITGPTGNGKSTMVEQACARNHREYIRLQINAQTDEDQLIGSKTLVDGNIQIIEGPVLLAMRAGAVLLLDELDAADANNILCLQSILEGKPYYFKLKNEMVYPAPGFNIFATANTKGRGSESGKYIGTKMLNEAFLERFPVTMQQEYPSTSVELKIIRNAMQKFNCVDENFAGILCKWSDIIRRTYEDGALDDLITTRRLIQIVQGYSIFKDKKLAVKLACNRFDSLTSSTFVDLFEKITPDDVKEVLEEVPVKEETLTVVATPF